MLGRQFVLKILVILFILPIGGLAFAQTGDALYELEESDRYIIEINYPEIILEDAFAAGVITDYVEEAKTLFIADVEEFWWDDAPAPFYFSIDPRTYTFSEDVQSIVLYINVYLGGAHGNLYFQTFVLDVANQRQLTLDDLFVADANPLEQIQPIVFYELGTRIGFDDWVAEGTAPIPENYAHYSIADNGLTFYFPPYQVAAYALGPQEVTIPFTSLRYVLESPFRDAAFANVYVENTEKYVIDIAYPVLVNNSTFVKDAVNTYTEDVRLAFVDFAESVELDELVGQWDLTIVPQQTRFSDDIYSVLLNIYEYTGGAHGNTFFKTFIFDLANERELTLGDLFMPGVDPYLAVQGIIRDELKWRLIDNGPISDEDWIQGGTEAIPTNYATYTLTSDAIVFYFPPYQVAPYAAGPQEVRVPFYLLEGQLNPRIMAPAAVG